jgi:hypothetical protein
MPSQEDESCLQAVATGMDPGQNSTQSANHPKIGRVAHHLAQSPVQDNIQVSAIHRGANTSLLFDAPRVLTLWHLASLDAPSVAMVWSLAFAWAVHIHLSGRVLVVLVLATWCAYVSDRILDARVLAARVGNKRLSSASDRTESSMPSALRERHYFHWRNRRLFVPLALAAASVAGVVALTLPISFVRERGSILAAAALAYFSGVHAAPWLKQRRHSLPRLVSKEFLVAVLFTAGCILPAWSRLRASEAQEFLFWWFWIPGIYFAVLAWLNCRLIAEWEAETSAHNAEAQRKPIGTFKLFSALSTNFSVAVLLASAGFLLACLASGSHSRASALLAAGALSALLLAILDSLRTRMTPLALRTGADFVLLTPLLLFLR